MLRSRAKVLCGILNGVDVNVWNPATDPRITSRYDCSSLVARRPNKQALAHRFGLQEEPDRLLVAFIGRFTWQKGIDLLAGAAPTLREIGAQIALLGTREREYEQRMVSLADAHRGAIGCVIGYDEDLAHVIQAGTDGLLVPSRFEPCGLTQLCALRYGAVPIVAKVGGLADTVIDLDERERGAANGINFNPVTQEALNAGLRRASLLWRDRPQWARVQANGMASDVSWSASARRYASLYAELLARKD